MELIDKKKEIEEEAEKLSNIINRGRAQLNQAEQRLIALMGQLELIAQLEQEEKEQ